MPDKRYRPNYELYLSFDSWTYSEAACLLTGINPNSGGRKINWLLIHENIDIEDSNRIEINLERLRRAAMAKTIPYHSEKMNNEGEIIDFNVTPKDFIAWITSNDFYIHPDFANSLKTFALHNSDTDMKSKTNNREPEEILHPDTKKKAPSQSDISTLAKENANLRWAPSKKHKTEIANLVMEQIANGCLCPHNKMVKIIENLENPDGSMAYRSDLVSESKLLETIKETYRDADIKSRILGSSDYIPPGKCPIHPTK